MAAADDWTPVRAAPASYTVPTRDDDWAPVAQAAPANPRPAPNTGGAAFGRVLRAIGSGFKDALRTDDPLGPEGENLEFLQRTGLVRGPQTRFNPATAITSPVITAGAQALDAVSRGFSGAVRAGARGVGQAAEEFGMEPNRARRLSRDLEGMSETALVLSPAAPALAARAPRRVAAQPQTKPQASRPRVQPGAAPRPDGDVFDWTPATGEAPQVAKPAAARTPKPIEQGPLEALPQFLIDQAQTDIKTMRSAFPKDDPSLLTKINRMGGIAVRDAAGNLTKEGQEIASLIKDVRMPGLIRDGGMRPDEILRTLRDEGYFGPRADKGHDLQDLYDLISQEAGGQRVYHPESQTARLIGERRGIERDYTDAGILPTDDPATAARKLAQYRYDVITGDLAEREAIMLEGSGTGAKRLSQNVKLGGIADDEAAILEETAARSGNFAEARRGVISHDETRRLAEELGMTPETLLKRRRGQAFNAEEALAARTELAKATEDLKTIRDRIRGGLGSDADRAAFVHALAQHGSLQEQVAGIAAEAGRALGIHRAAVRDVQQAKAIREMVERAGGPERVDDLAEMMAALDDPAQVAQFVRNLQKPAKWDMIMEGWKSMLLSGPVTHAVNALSNSINALMPIAETTVAAGLGAVRNATSLPQPRVMFREVGPQIFGLLEGAKEGLRIAANTFATEIPKDMQLATELRTPQAIPSITLRRGAQKARVGGVPIPFTGEMQLGGKQIRAPLRALSAADDFFKEVATRQTINQLAMRQALREGLEGKALAARVHELKMSPTDEMLEAAKREARYRTFTNELGSAGKKFQGALRDYPGWQVVFPFVRTPVNIVKYAAERTPAAFAMRQTRADLLGRNGTIAADTARARLLIGSSLGATVAYYAAQGLITGQGPPDPRERAALRATGWQPYSVRVGDQYVSYQRMAPLAMIMGATADMVEAHGAMNERDADDIATLITGSITKNITNQTFLRGASDLIAALENPSVAGERWIENMAGTLVPTGVAHYAAHEDPYLREVGGIMDAIKRRTPGQSQGLPAVLDFFGEPIKREGALGPDLVSPFYVSRVKNDPVAREIVRLGVLPSKVDRTLNGVPLSPAQYSEYQATAGKLAKSFITNLIQSPGYRRAPDGVKAELIERILNDAKEASRRRLRARYPELATSAAQRRVGELLGEREAAPANDWAPAQVIPVQ